LSKTDIVFSYAGDLWRVPREGGAAVRLTGGTGFETEAVFSPDGKTIAFTGEYDGNIDVYTVPLSGVPPSALPSPSVKICVMRECWCDWSGRGRSLPSGRPAPLTRSASG